MTIRTSCIINILSSLIRNLYNCAFRVLMLRRTPFVFKQSVIGGIFSRGCIGVLIWNDLLKDWLRIILYIFVKCHFPDNFFQMAADSLVSFVSSSLWFNKRIFSSALSLIVLWVRILLILYILMKCNENLITFLQILISLEHT